MTSRIQTNPKELDLYFWQISYFWLDWFPWTLSSTQRSEKS